MKNNQEYMYCKNMQWSDEDNDYVCILGITDVAFCRLDYCDYYNVDDDEN